MTLSHGRILHAGRPEVTLDDHRLPLGAPEVGAHGSKHLLVVPRPAPPERVRLHVVVQELVRVEIRAVTREEEQPEPVGPLRHPPRHLGGPVDRVAIDNEEHEARGVPEEPAEEAEEHLPVERAPEHHEGEFAPIRDRREDVAPEPLAGPGDDRGLPLPAVGGARLVVRAEAHLIAPVDLGPGLFRRAPDGRVLLGQLPPHRHRVLLEGPAAGFLGRKGGRRF